MRQLIQTQWGQFILGLAVLAILPICVIAVNITYELIRLEQLDGSLVLPPLLEEEYASWSPDGQFVAYICYLDGPTSSYSPEALWYYEHYATPYHAEYTIEAGSICLTDLTQSKHERLTQEVGRMGRPVWSPTGDRLAYTRNSGTGDIIYVFDLASRTEQPVVNGTVDQANLIWSPDGQDILFAGCLDKRDSDIYLVNLDSHTVQNLTSDSNRSEFAATWLTDRQEIFFLSSIEVADYCDFSPDDPYQMKVMNVDGSDVVSIYEPLLSYHFSISTSVKGQIAFVRDAVSETELGSQNEEQAQLYIMNVDDDTPTRIDTVNPNYPLENSTPFVYLWSPDGRYLLYRDQAGEVQILDSKTTKKYALLNDASPWNRSHPEQPTWSPDGRYIAVTVEEWITEGDSHRSESHIVLVDWRANTSEPLLR